MTCISDQLGGLHLVARQGELLEVLPSDFRELSNIYFGRPETILDADIPRLNDRGQVVFIADFTDGTSGVFVSSPLVIPEPSAMALCIVVLVGMVNSRTLPR